MVTIKCEWGAESNFERGAGTCPAGRKYKRSVNFPSADQSRWNLTAVDSYRVQRCSKKGDVKRKSECSMSFRIFPRQNRRVVSPEDQHFQLGTKNLWGIKGGTRKRRYETSLARGSRFPRGELDHGTSANQDKLNNQIQKQPQVYFNVPFKHDHSMERFSNMSQSLSVVRRWAPWDDLQTEKKKKKRKRKHR